MEQPQHSLARRRGQPCHPREKLAALLPWELGQPLRLPHPQLGPLRPLLLPCAPQHQQPREQEQTACPPAAPLWSPRPRQQAQLLGTLLQSQHRPPQTHASKLQRNSLSRSVSTMQPPARQEASRPYWHLQHFQPRPLPLPQQAQPLLHQHAPCQAPAPPPEWPHRMTGPPPPPPQPH